MYVGTYIVSRCAGPSGEAAELTARRKSTPCQLKVVNSYSVGRNYTYLGNLEKRGRSIKLTLFACVPIVKKL